MNKLMPLVVLGLILSTIACTPFKMHLCSEVPSILDKVEQLAPYAGKDACLDASVGVSLEKK